MAGGGRTEIGDGGWRVAYHGLWRRVGGWQAAVERRWTDWSRSLD